MYRKLQTAVVLLAVAGACGAQSQRDRWDAPRIVPLHLIVTIDGDMEKASNVTVELMDAVGSSSAMDRKLTDNDGVVIFQALSGLHRIRITGPYIEPYEGELEIVRNEASHVERIRVRHKEGERQPSESPRGGTVAAVRLNVPASARKAYDKGSEAMRQQRWHESRTLLETAIREYPQYDMAYLNLGVVQIQLNEVEAARQSFSKAIELNPEFAAAHRSLARILLAEHKNSEALQSLKRSLATEPDNPWALFNAAYLELQGHSFEDALADALKLHALPHEGMANTHMVSGYAAEALGRRDLAVKEFRLYLKEDPGGPNVKRVQEILSRLSEPKKQ